MPRIPKHVHAGTPMTRIYSSTHVTLKVRSLRTYSNTHSFPTSPVKNAQRTSIHASAHAYIIHIDSGLQTPPLQITYT